MEAYNMILQFPGVDELLQSPSDEETGLALEELWNMLKKDPTDSLRLSDIIPHVLLELDQEQTCYDFIKWWALHGPKSLSGSPNSPFFDLEGADACESLSTLPLSRLSLSHLVALTLLKLRLCMDLGAITDEHFDTSIGFNGDEPIMDFSLGLVAEDVFETTREWSDFAELLSNVENQYLDLCKQVNEVNPHFWEALVTEEPNFSSTSETPGPGSRNEADFVLYHCRRAWDKSSDALKRIECDTSHYVRPYIGPTGVNESKTLKKHRGTGRVFPTRLDCADLHPDDEDILTGINIDHERGWSLFGEQSKLLLYANGHCTFNGKWYACGGWSVSFGNDDPRLPCQFISDRLEEKGPFGDCEKATSNRAELRAVVAALRLNDWKAEGFTSIVVATASSYVLNGATKRAKSWISNGWKFRNGKEVDNKDLWQLLLGEVERWGDEGLDVFLLEIPQHLNEEANMAAKVAAEMKPDREEFTDIALCLSQPSPPEPKLQAHALFVCLAGSHHFQKFSCRNICAPDDKPTEHAFNPEAALEYLNGLSPPSMILIADAMITRHREVLERIIDRMRDGTTVIVSGSFGTTVTSSELGRFFSILDLPWQKDADHDAEPELQCSVRNGKFRRFWLRATGLPPLPKGVERRTENPVSWYTDPTSGLAFTKIGLGRLVLDAQISTTWPGLLGQLDLPSVEFCML
ncbi:hypothetical protein FPOAC2_11848 [Fusarium poae]|jgi:ribonuclease HI|uniref:ribonuclease H n=1 Tax=Fusarium poae TaxID=36050 RepID=A0A1B8AEX4_FUSPO|nr:hypothetical protein FPOAC1_011541 [Fusarium poae]KAG8666727.1 hypothetical protein FPOAC1_011541 [Fusarium poae]OBS18979.1 hypothetical protein FPOA_10704 [Fusarium poae]